MIECQPINKALERSLRYSPQTYKAYCKYCRRSHRLWQFDGRISGEMVSDVWKCNLCDSRTNDINMQIEGVRQRDILVKRTSQKVTFKYFTQAKEN